MTAAIPPWTNCPPCPACTTPVATPQATDPDWRRATTTPRDLFCPACGHGWREADLGKVAWAWYSAGCWEGKQQAEEVRR